MTNDATTEYPVEDAIELAESRTGLSLRDAIRAQGGQEDWDALRAALTWHLEELLEYRVQMLPQLLYRVDVRESAVNAVFANAPAGTIAPRLAELIISRLVEKLETRKRYEGLL